MGKSKILFGLAAILVMILPSVMAEVLISEVLYDPTTPNDNTEFVELYNIGDTNVDISGWSLNTTRQQALFPAGTHISPGGYYLISDSAGVADWPVIWPLADYQDSLSLTNTNSGVKLINSAGVVLDVVGWGNPPAALFLGTAHKYVAEGHSLSRISEGGSFLNTMNNSFDFAEAAPSPMNSHSKEVEAGTQEIQITATVHGNTPLIQQLTISPDDSDAPGNQVMPFPGNIKLLEIDASIADPDGYGDVVSVAAVMGPNTIAMPLKQVLNQTTAIYSANLSLDYYEAPGNYTLQVQVSDKSGLNATAAANFEYLSVVAFDTDTKDISFDTLSGSSSDALGDQDMSTLANPTIQNIGNTALDFKVSGTDLQSGPGTISADNLAYSFLDSDFTGELAGTLSSIPTLQKVNLPAEEDSLTEFSLRLVVPPGTASGDYKGTLYLTGVAS